jgi:GAF domain-containing protein
MLRGVAFGNVYLAEKTDAEGFSDEDEQVVRLLAAQAAVAIANARLYESARQWARQLEALNEVSAALASGLDLAQLFRLTVTHLRALIDARVVMVQVPTTDGLSLTVETADGEHADELLGLRVDRAGSRSGLTLTRARAERIDSLIEDPEVNQTVPRLVEASAALYVPLVVQKRVVGVIVAYDKTDADPRFTEADTRLAEAFANRAAIAVDLSERVARDTILPT